jgi:hypothetical protein
LDSVPGSSALQAQAGCCRADTQPCCARRPQVGKLKANFVGTGFSFYATGGKKVRLPGCRAARLLGCWAAGLLGCWAAGGVWAGCWR